MNNKSILINESEMEFGPFDEKDIFYIEKSRIYEEHDICYKNKIAEFVLLKNDTTIILEAKTSFPKEGIGFDETIEKICQKFKNSNLLTTSMVLKRHPEFYDELPSNFKDVKILKKNVSLVLMIRNHRTDWLYCVQDNLRNKLKPFCNICGIDLSKILVSNPDCSPGIDVKIIV